MDDDVAGAAPVVVTLPAEIDIANADQVFGRLCLAIGSGAGLVIADLTGTDFCGSAGIGAVLMARDRAAAEGVQLRLALQPSGPVRSLFELMGLDQKLPIYPSLGHALAGDQAPDPQAPSAQVIYLASRRRRSLPGSGQRPPGRPAATRAIRCSPQRRISLLNPICHQKASGATTTLSHRRGQDHHDVTTSWFGSGAEDRRTAASRDA
jgi:anti-sigma B factor antagonist